MSQLLVEVVRVGDLTKNPNADTLMITQVKGWILQVKEGEFTKGDLAVYLPIDSVIPDTLAEKYELTYLKNGERVKTIKLRGVVSQGLLLSIGCLPEPNKAKEGDDVSEVLGVTKWEPPAPQWQQQGPKGKRKRGSANNPNPDFAKYTDIDNIKNYPGVFTDGDQVVITEKIHGTNFRVAYLKRHCQTLFQKFIGLFNPYQFLVGSHNVQISDGRQCSFYGTDVYSKVSRKYKLDEVLKNYPGYELFGEVYGMDSQTGAKIQDLTYGKNELDVAFFDLMKDGQYLPFDQFMDFCAKHSLPTVPLLYRGELRDGIIEQCTAGDSILASLYGTKQIREGAVVKDPDETLHIRVGRKVLKSISPDYLLRKGGTENH